MSFTFKQFSVNDSHCAMKIGTDGVLLGAWVDTDRAQTIADIGAGSGLVALMMAQRTVADITAVEIDPEATADMRLNFAASPWSARLTAANDDFSNVDGVFDLIVSNPPFFAGTLRSPDPSRAIARHGDALCPRSLVEYAARHLADNGTLAMITDYDSHADTLFDAEMAGLKLRRFTAVSSYSGRPPFRALWQFGRHDGPCQKSTLAIRDENGAYTVEYRRLTCDFYL